MDKINYKGDNMQLHWFWLYLIFILGMHLVVGVIVGLAWLMVYLTG